jgi:hypothetical protein
MMTVPPRLRADVLRYASRLTTERDVAVAAVINTAPMLAWLEAATDEYDLMLRMQALRQQDVNRTGAPADDDPDRFVREAKVLYAFLTADGMTS